MIILQCKLSPEDYIQAQYLHMQSSSWLKYLVIAVLSLCFVNLVASAPLISLTSALTAFVPILFLGLAYALIRFVTVPLNARRIFSQQKTLQMEYQAVISLEMIETFSEQGTARMRLSDFHKYKVGKDLILLYQSQALFHMFTRRFFASEEDFNTFLSYLKANLGSPKR